QPQHIKNISQSASTVYYIFNYKDMLAFDIAAQILDDSDHAAGAYPMAVAGNAKKINVMGNGQLAHQVSEKYHAAFQQGHQGRLFPRIIRRDSPAQQSNGIRDLLGG
ncbi:MAG: hypothetical protein ABIA59_04490, partial [Candidatus Latescibacterota bacterium]